MANPEIDNHCEPVFHFGRVEIPEKHLNWILSLLYLYQPFHTADELVVIVRNLLKQKETPNVTT